jgi:predicted glycoside hydrolase/deacetylase ChbG (UPF0249 family)
LLKENPMHPNPVLKELGFADDDRVAIIHADDIGMCQATLPAFADLIDFGLVSSGSVMVPCPWFPQVTVYCAQHPEVDLGVHLTLNSEWSSYRWGPVSTRDPASGLMDEAGYFHPDTESVQIQANPAAVQTELAAQVARALAAGIDVTHIDTHMGTVAHPKFIPGYVQLAQQHRLPFLMLRLDEAGWRAAGMDDETAAFAAQFVLQLEEQGVPMLDHLSQELPLDQHEDRVEVAKRVFDSLPPGLTHFILHPACDTPELRAIGSDWRARIADYRAFISPELRDYVRNAGIHVIGYWDLRDLVRDE